MSHQCAQSIVDVIRRVASNSAGAGTRNNSRKARHAALCANLKSGVHSMLLRKRTGLESCHEVYLHSVEVSGAVEVW